MLKFLLILGGVIKIGRLGEEVLVVILLIKVFLLFIFKLVLGIVKLIK